MICILSYLKIVYFSVLFVFKSSRLLTTTQFLIKLSIGLIPFFNIYLIEKLFSSLIDVFQKNSDVMNCYFWSSLLALINFFLFLLNSLNNYLQKKIAFQFEEKLKTSLLLSSKKIPYQSFESSQFQNKYSRMLQSHNSLLNTFDSVLSIVQSFVSLISVTFYLIKLHILFSLIIFIMIIPLMIIEMKYGKVRFDLNVGLSENSRKLHYLENLLINKSTLKEIRLGQKENYILKNWIKSYKVNAVSQMKIEKKQMYLQSVVQIIISLSFVFSISLVIYLVSNSLLKLAALTAVIQAVQNLQGIVPSFANNLANSYEATLSVDEFQKFQNQLGKTDNIKKLDIEKLEVLTVKNLNYYYPNSHHKALNNINLSISKSKKIAIMGNNGSGKSTLVKCMTGLYESKNSVLLNNEYLIEDVNLESLWNEVNVMFQDFNKYEMTMAENISMDNLNINNEKLESLLELVGLKDLFDQFPNKSNTQLGNLFNKGKELSGGQWQKIALARAIYNQKSFLFLDEPTSALDPDSEYQVIESILKKLNEVGIIYITHRVNVAKLADIIIYMKNGEITEQGTHEELIKKGGDYSEVFARQIGSLIEHKEGVINA